MSAFKHVCFLATAVFLFSMAAFCAQDPINVEAVVNIVDSSDDSKVAEAMKKANEILGQAGIKLVPVKVNKPYTTGDGNGNLTDAEGTAAVGEGEDELDDTCGSGNGLKVNIADDVWVEKPSTNGWAIHRRPVVFTEPDSDPNVMGNTIAHEVCHSLTLGKDTYDPNDKDNLLYGYTSRGTSLTEDQIAEIRKGAKKRVPSWLGRNIRRAWKWITKAGQALLDELNDIMVGGVPVNIIGFAQLNFLDVRTVEVSCENPDAPGSELIVEINPQGAYPPDSFFDVFYRIDFDANQDMIPDGRLTMHVWREPSVPGQLFAEATYDTFAGALWPVPLQVHTNERHYTPAEGMPYIPVIFNNTLEAALPLTMMDIDGTAFLDGIGVNTMMEAIIHSPIGFLMPGNVVTDEIAPMVVKAESPCACREVHMISSGQAESDPQWPDKPQYVDVIGCDFAGDVGLYINDEPMGVGVAGPDGDVSIRAEVGGLAQGTYTVMLQELFDETTPTRADWAIGYLDLRPVIEGDVDDDGHVNLVDFAMLAENWLK